MLRRGEGAKSLPVSRQNRTFPVEQLYRKLPLLRGVHRDPAEHLLKWIIPNIAVWRDWPRNPNVLVVGRITSPYKLLSIFALLRHSTRIIQVWLRRSLIRKGYIKGKPI